ncbi:enoyl-CoA hydratase/isomerase family protein [Caenimonas aquaedulcis]|uniref:Enoyl-CoA hydratase/isomerase family protein n=1 Tax=Caenimonas aquaedulcis TaxID=2793270 RepID=A0A931H945_9BURK|nr:enoyl-CoA hydratase/isomerase family protein [Caenimonas aquaedulcis]MBG9390600.1 enoyl-CoA hydratase/isomerase family protein [Caenimonas aquaedulcis]
MNMRESGKPATRSIEVELGEGGVAMITINRPHKRNALDRAARGELREALIATSDGGFRCVIVTGTGASFCSGVDLKEYAADRASHVTEEPATDWTEINLAIRSHPAVFISAVNGVALGGGVTLLGVCDLALAADDAIIGLPEVSFGAFPQLSGPAAQFHLTPKRAAWLALTADQIDGATAAQWGLVNESLPADRLIARAREIAARIAAFKPEVLSKTKSALDDMPGMTRPWRQAFERGLRVNDELRHGIPAR